MLLDYSFKFPCIVDGGINLSLIPDYTCVITQPCYIPSPKTRDFRYFETVKCFLKVGPLVAYELPTKACLEYTSSHVLKVLGVCFRSFIRVYPVWGCPVFSHDYGNQQGFT